MAFVRIGHHRSSVWVFFEPALFELRPQWLLYRSKLQKKSLCSPIVLMKTLLCFFQWWTLPESKCTLVDFSRSLMQSTDCKAATYDFSMNWPQFASSPTRFLGTTHDSSLFGPRIWPYFRDFLWNLLQKSVYFVMIVDFHVVYVAWVGKLWVFCPGLKFRYLS